MKFDLNQRRKSFPPQKDITTTACKSSQSANNISSIDMDANICPLTEENLAIHTRNVSRIRSVIGMHVYQRENIVPCLQRCQTSQL